MAISRAGVEPVIECSQVDIDTGPVMNGERLRRAGGAAMGARESMDAAAGLSVKRSVFDVPAITPCCGRVVIGTIGVWAEAWVATAKDGSRWGGYGRLL